MGSQKRNPSETRKRSFREKWAEIPLERKLAMFVAPLVVSVVSAVVLSKLIGDNDSGSTGGGEAQVEIVDLVPVNSRDEQTRIEISVRNIGQAVSVLTRVDFQIRSNSYVSPCGLGARLGLSHTYDLELPEYPEDGEIIPVRISQEIRPNQADRFAFSVGVVTPSGAEPNPVVYQLGVSLYHDGKEQPVNAGEIVIVEPFPSASSYFSEDYWKGMPPAKVHDCVTSNITSVESVLRLKGVRSAELTELARSLKT